MSYEIKEGCVRVEEQMAPFTNKVTTHRHHFLADEPEKMGGADEGPAPMELVMAGLGACTSMTLRMYAQRKQWPLEKVTVDLTHDKQKDGTETLTRHIKVAGDLSEEQTQRLLEIANKCPVHRTLTNENMTIPSEMEHLKES